MYALQCIISQQFLGCVEEQNRFHRLIIVIYIVTTIMRFKEKVNRLFRISGGKNMGHVIAVSGKGGVGKTTLCGLLIQYLCESGKRPVLAVDADANANLNEVLGVEPEITLGELREEIERAGVDPRYQIPSGMTKQAYLEMRLSDAIAEEDD